MKNEDRNSIQGQRRFLLVVLAGVLLLSLISALFSLLLSALRVADAQDNLWLLDWGSTYLQNASSEFLGAFGTYVIFEIVVRRREQQQAEYERMQEKRERILRYIASNNSELAKQYIVELRADQKLMSENPLRAYNLNGAALSGGVDLRDMNLEEATLIKANLQNANLSGINLKNADLRGADLTGANLTNADLSGAVLDDAILYGASFQNATLYGISLCGAILTNAKFDSQPKLEGAVLPNSDIFSLFVWESNIDLRKYTFQQP